REPAMGLRGVPEAEVLFEDMEIAADALILPPRGLRKGFADLMNAYNGQRIGAATVALGLAEGAYELGLAYSQERHQFGRPICEFRVCSECWPTWLPRSRRRVCWSTRRPSAGATGFPNRPKRRRPRSSPPRWQSRSPTARCNCSERLATPETDRSNAWRATRA